MIELFKTNPEVAYWVGCLVGSLATIISIVLVSLIDKYKKLTIVTECPKCGERAVKHADA